MNPSRERTIRVPPEFAGWRLDRTLAELAPQSGSRTFWQRAIRQGAVCLNGQPVRASTLVRADDTISVDEPSAAQPQPAVQAASLDPACILYEDPFLLVVNKPVGMVVHPSRGHAADSLVQALMPWLSESERFPELGRPGIVHRLDKDTSGCLLVARTRDVHERLAEALKQREIHRLYLGLTQGVVNPPQATVEAPVGRDPKHRLKMATVRQGRPARTHWLAVAEWNAFSLLWLKLDTGRTHQIRVHLSSLGHPLIGDILYGGSPQGDFATQALHAWQIRFDHPVTGREMMVNAPLPRGWRALWRTLGAPSRLGRLPPAWQGLSTQTLADGFAALVDQPWAQDVVAEL